MVAIKIKEPGKVARWFGEAAGDFRPYECRWWVGEPGELYPAAEPPAGARVITAPVSFIGGSAWIQHTPARLKVREKGGRCRDVRGTGYFVEYAKRGDSRYVRCAMNQLKAVSALYGRAPLP
jgi:hypothetical protein